VAVAVDIHIVCSLVADGLQVPVPAAVLGLTWAGKSLLLAVPGGYQALHPVVIHAANHHQQQQQATGYQLVVLADHLASIQPLLGSIPEQGLALMLWEENMVLVTDASGGRNCGASWWCVLIFELPACLEFRCAVSCVSARCCCLVTSCYVLLPLFCCGCDAGMLLQ
jgi:hypothetical protein